MKRETPVSHLVRKAMEEKAFDSLIYRSRPGQPGVTLEIYSGKFSAWVTVENNRYGDCYPNKDGTPTRISMLSLSKNPYTDSFKNLGEWHPRELVRKSRHRFEKQAEKDVKLKELLEKIINYFG